MGAHLSKTTYDPNVEKIADWQDRGNDAANTIYERFLIISQGSQNFVTEDVFMSLFPFTTELAQNNFRKIYLDPKDYTLSLKSFAKLFAALDPMSNNMELQRVIFLTFKTDDGNFDLGTFFDELQANFFFTHIGARENLENHIRTILARNKCQWVYRNQRIIDINKYKDLFCEDDDTLRMYAKHLIFSSFIFQ